MNPRARPNNSIVTRRFGGCRSIYAASKSDGEVCRASAVRLFISRSPRRHVRSVLHVLTPGSKW
jgi:hypothetical protein